ncbi:MAG: ATP-binding protein [Clostridia bacterium]|nr:ATP-binding protein [Clostridia bacterium]
MNTTILKSLLIIYENKRDKKIKEAENRKIELYTQNPRFEEIDSALSSLSINASKNLINSHNFEYLNNLRKEIESLKKEKHDLLVSITNDENYLKPIYDCKMCNDTGYITENYNTKMCSCLKQQLYDMEYNKTNALSLENHNFDNFLSTLYSCTVDKSKYNSDISPRENIEKIKKISQNFIDNFDDSNQKNLLFTGNTGLGKTFLSGCIANEIIKSGKNVLYQTSPVMLDSIIDFRFGKTDGSIYHSLLDVDLLIIDDLGTESMNNMKFSELFNVINTRLLNQNKKITKTIISTNLDIQNLFKNYDERIVSRLIGNYDICRFFGDDIRLIKKISSQKK